MSKDKHDMRVLLGRLRTGNPNYGRDLSKTNEKNKVITVREMLGNLRKLNEEFTNSPEQKNLKNNATDFDKKYWIDRFNAFFDDLNITINNDDVFDLEVYDDYVFWGAAILGQIQFLFAVTEDENTSGVQFNYAKDFNANNEDNQEIIKRIEVFYEEFADYWRKNK